MTKGYINDIIKNLKEEAKKKQDNILSYFEFDDVIKRTLPFELYLEPTKHIQETLKNENIIEILPEGIRVITDWCRNSKRKKWKKL